MAVHVELELHKKNTDALDKAFKVSRKKFAAVIVVEEKQRVRLNAVGTVVAEFKNRRDVEIM